MKIALVSLNQIWEDKESNLDLCINYIKEASKSGVELIIFPEMTLTGFTMNIDAYGENEIESSTIDIFKKLAHGNKIAIIFGVIIKEKDKASNRLYFIGGDGDIIGGYTKIHPFTFANENKYFNAGEKPQIVEYNGIRFGLSICYDLRFSNLYQYYGINKTDCIINISNWPSKRIDHWNTLLKARAIENQQFIIGVNRIGRDGNNLDYMESSVIYDANGDMLGFAEKVNDMKILNIDKDWTENYKNKFNTIQDTKEIR